MLVSLSLFSSLFQNPRFFSETDYFINVLTILEVAEGELLQIRGIRALCAKS